MSCTPAFIINPVLSKQSTVAKGNWRCVRRKCAQVDDTRAVRNVILDTTYGVRNVILDTTYGVRNVVSDITYGPAQYLPGLNISYNKSTGLEFERLGAVQESLASLNS